MSNTTHTIKSIQEYIKAELQFVYPAEEIQSFIDSILFEVLKCSRIDAYLHNAEGVSVQHTREIVAIIEQLKRKKPIQYLLGDTDFYGCKIHVNENVLIPRPETEELVRWIIEDNIGKLPGILDIGTGSGCIAIALCKQFETSRIDAMDVSEDAISIARLNSKHNNCKINFFSGDILKGSIPEARSDYDIIVSNPPYVTESEKQFMDANVLDYEPEIALFVPDNDALKYYRAIALFAKNNLKESGYVYVEINESLANETKSVFRELGFTDIELKTDIYGKNRMIKCTMA